MQKTDIVIIGAGVIGLATAMELAKGRKDIFVVERNDSFGRETSSRNSEVVHSGIYYPKGSLKATACIRGRELLYDFCVKNGVPFKKIGKLIVAADNKEVPGVEELFKCGSENGVRDLQMLSRDEVKSLEPNIRAEAALYSPSTGIIDSHSFMKKMLMSFRAAGGQISYGSDVVDIKKVREGFEITVTDTAGEGFKFLTAVLINAAGLNSYKIAAMAGAGKDEYRLKYCKGSYFRVGQRKAHFINRLIYPLPERYRTGLGIHATLDTGGGMRLGPDAEYVDAIDYSVDGAKKMKFYESVSKFLPFIEPQDLSPDTAGVRPKLQGPGEAFRDFIIKEESDNGLPGLINLIGIESPGLTASLAIAGMVKDQVVDLQVL